MGRWLIITVVLISGNVFGQDNPLGLQHIRLTPEFAASIATPTSARAKSMGTQAQTATPTLSSDAAAVLVPHLFGPEFSELSTRRSAKSGTPTDGQESLLYGRIKEWLDGRYQSIGTAEADRIGVLNQQFNLGLQNFSGFSWQKPFGSFGIHVDRQLSPEIGHESRWIVMDTFTINVEATTFLEKLNEAGATDLSAVEIRAFAGMTFKRVYTTYHFAADYLSALKADFKYLFLPFLYHTPEGALNLDGGKIIKRQDTWTIGAGGIVETPAWYGFSFSGGAMAEITNQTTVSMQNIMPAQATKPGEFLRLAHISKQTKSAGVSAGLQLDFFKLIKFTLLSFDLEFSSSKQKEYLLSFQEKHRALLTGNSDTAREFNSIIKKSSPDVVYLEPNVVELDNREMTSSSSTLMLLLWGNLKKSSMEQVRIVKDEVVKTFFKNYNESIKLVQNFWSRLFSSFIFRLLKFSTGIANDAALTKRLNIEYEATLPQSPDPDKMAIAASEQFSMLFSLSYEAARTDRWTDKSYRKDTEEYMERFTSLPADLRGMVRNEDLRGPLFVSTTIRVTGVGLDYFLHLPEGTIKKEFDRLCENRSSCVKSLMTPYQDFKKIWSSVNRLELAVFKKMMTKLMNEMDDLVTAQILFGDDAFINGNFQATSRSGLSYSRPFSVGTFKGAGVIDNYKRQDGIRHPASIWDE